MATRNEPTAAQSLYPNLPSSARPERQQSGPRLSEAMYPSLAPKPQPAPPNRYRESTMTLAQRCDEDPWFEYRLALSGIRRKR